MAGAGARLFPENSKLTSAQVNTFLMDQTIMRFATTTARDAAFGGVGEPTLAEGMTAYIDADNTIYTYDGSNWIKMISASQPPAMQLVGTFTASGVSRALVCDNVFTSEYENYHVVYRLQSTLQLNSAYFQFLDTAGAIVSAGYYSQTYAQDYATNGSTTFSTLYTNAGVYIGSIPNLNGGPSMLNASFNIYAPTLVIATAVTGQNVGIRSGAAFYGGQIMSQMTNNQQHRGIRFDNDGGGNLTGTVSIYGYRK